MANIRRAGKASGRVQGVGFRAFVQEIARSMGIVGWVKNMPDGSVTMEAEGDEKLFEEFYLKIKEGNGWRRVDDLQFEERPALGSETDFVILR